MRLLLVKNLSDKENVAMILGDNFFYGQSLSSLLIKMSSIEKRSKNILHKVQNLDLSGVAKINEKNKKILKIVEKPKKFISISNNWTLFF